ncbi:HesB/IscA family protein [Agarilytica rhodophyticola]|uniref:HesB/IscA family protein n=1 Tax=Agarilytica rhodophyticola TaxID=1737490 RepID=UPI000B341038|nr:iron-sulfur cluster assembly accessory protein [Agarilytica rhodophyticola]
MSVETFSAEQSITVTNAAAEHFARELAKKGGQAVRISLKQSGCTGFKYVIDEVESREDGDLTITLENGIAVYLDPKHLAALNGTVIDYVQQGLNKNLVLDNPNVKDMCGCGESFNV